MKPDFLKNTKHNLLINESIIEMLKKYNIDVDEYSSLSEIMYKIDDILNNEELEPEEIDELDYIGEILQENNYYLNTNK